MHFSRLRLQGFKSFVDPTELVIAHGLTGVVGPNGCGKSNLLEALRWVMGETRASQMRGGGMEDVIFAGASSRPPRNNAEVSIAIDNPDRTAPVAFNDADQLEIVRRITRDVGSAYKLNGKDVRARDVQMLFADAATGAHSPALVRQGQIGELINAKPKARRRILEDAAGIAGLYQRRHEAELKLKGAETNLGRVDDVLDNLDQRLSALSRQAKQAHKYRDLSEELRAAEALLLYIHWREADHARLTAEEALTAAVRAAGVSQAEATSCSAAREKAETAMPPLRQEEAAAGAILQRALVERDRLDAEEARARQNIEKLETQGQRVADDLEREETLDRDAEENLRRLAVEEEDLKTRGAGHPARRAEAVAHEQKAVEDLRTAETAFDQLSEDAARLAARHTAAERRLDQARQMAEKNSREAEAAERDLDALTSEATGAEGKAAETKTAEEVARAAAAAAEAECETCETARGLAQNAEAEARTERSEAEGAASAIRAEVDGLRRLLSRDQDGARPVLDAIRVDEGIEAALGAALGEDLSAPLADGDEGGWRAYPAYGDEPALPAGSEPLSAHVAAPPALARRLAQIGLATSEDAARLAPDLRPGQRLVTRDGDLWRWDGFRVIADNAPSAAALRLRQQNRLDRLTADLDTAAETAQKATDAHEAARAALTAATEADAAARRKRREADQALADAARLSARAEADLGMLRGKTETLELVLERRRAERQDTQNELAEAESASDELEDLDAAREAAETARGRVDASREAMLAARAARDDLDRTEEARAKRATEVVAERETWKSRLSNAGARIAELKARAEEIEQERKRAVDAPATIEAEREKVAAAIETGETRRKAAADALAEGETTLRATENALREAERAASTAREEKARAEERSETATTRVAEAAERIRTGAETEPEALLEELGADPATMPPADELELRIASISRRRDGLGAVNLRAEEDAREVEEERGTLGTEKDDLEAAIAKLRQGIGELNREGRQRLLAAFEQVNRSFSTLFKHLFGGGEANLQLVESDDPLEAGLEIMCMPPGKRLSTLSLLSGGEQTLTALSLIFAVFLANPSPICVLDEVDAPLDDSNVERFCDLLDEMTRRTETRFLIITHHALTMSRMDRLFGVTMVEKGVSQLVSVDLAKATELVEV